MKIGRVFLILLVVGVFFVPGVQAQLGFDAVIATPNNDATTGSPAIDGDHFGDRFSHDQYGNYYFWDAHWDYLFYSVSTDGGQTYTKPAMFYDPDTSIPNRIGLCDDELVHVVQDNTNSSVFHVFTAYFDVGYTPGLRYSKLISDSSGNLHKGAEFMEAINNNDPLGSSYRGMGAIEDSQHRLICAWFNGTTKLLEMYRSDDAGLTWDKFTYDPSAYANIRTAKIRLEVGYNDTLRISLLHDTIADPGDHYLLTFQHDNLAGWASGGLYNFVQVSDSDVDTYYECVLLSDNADRLHFIYPEKTTNNRYHVLISGGIQVSKTFLGTDNNVTYRSASQLLTYGLIMQEQDRTTERIWYRLFDGADWGSRILAHYDATKDWGRMISPKHWSSTENFKTLVWEEDGIYDDVWVINYNFGAGNSSVVPKIPPSLENPTLSATEWFYEGEIYTLGFDTNNYTENGRIIFTDKDAVMNIGFNVTQNRAWFDNGGAEFKGSVVDFDLTRNATTYHWDIRFTFGSGIDDCLDVDFNYSVQNFNHDWTISGTFASDYKIYNLGGFVMNRYALNDAGWFAFGDPLEVYSQYNASTSWANTSIVYRKIQKYHAQISLAVSDNDVFDTMENTGDVEIHLQYYNETSGGWYDLCYIAFDIVKGAVDSGTGVGIGKAWVDIYWQLYGRTGAGIMYANRSGYFTAYPNCGDDVTAGANTLDFWVDFWLDSGNNSRGVGMNINPTYYGVDETGGWIFWQSWRPIMTNGTYGTAVYPLKDYNGNTIQADNLELMRVATYVITGSLTDTYEWSLRDFRNQDILLADGRLRGVDRPEIVQTLVVDMGNSGFLSGLRKAIQNIATQITNALAGVWKTTIGLIDTILVFVGLPEGTFTSIIYVIGSMLSVVNVILADFEDLLTYALSSLTQTVLVIVAVGSRVLLVVTELVTTFLSFWNLLISFFTGNWVNVGEIWNTYNIWSFFQLWIIAIFPFWEIDRLSNSDNWMKTAKEDVETFQGIVTGLFKFFAFILGLIQQVFNLIIEIVRG